jgi:hypothetical protein
MAAGPRERLTKLLREAEKSLRQIRNDIRKRAASAPKDLQAAALRLRKGAADIAGQVEKYVHDLRVGLEGKPSAARRPVRKAARRKRKARA